jgi:hypothetical protein
MWHSAVCMSRMLMPTGANMGYRVQVVLTPSGGFAPPLRRLHSDSATSGQTSMFLGGIDKNPGDSRKPQRSGMMEKTSTATRANPKRRARSPPDAPDGTCKDARYVDTNRPNWTTSCFRGQTATKLTARRSELFPSAHPLVEMNRRLAWSGPRKRRQKSLPSPAIWAPLVTGTRLE